MQTRSQLLLYSGAVLSLALLLPAAIGQQASPPNGPDPREIAIPAINAPIAKLPGVAELPVRTDMPPVLLTNAGVKVTNQRQWQRRREEMRRILAYYAVGQMPPPPGNVKGQVLKSETLLEGTVNYRLVRLTFGPNAKLELNIGIFAPAAGGPFPAIILQGGTPPGAPVLPRLPQGPNQGKGENVLLLVGPAAGTPPAPRASAPPPTAEALAAQRADLFRRGYALVLFNPNDCAEDTTLRESDGSWAFRTTRFYPAYPGYDWGILAGWAWGASRVADYLETDRSIDKTKLIVTGASRNGKSAMVAAAFDDRLMGAPVVTGGGGVGAYRFAGPRRSETLDVMQKKYPNWFSPHLHEFWGQREKLPFDEHWFLALAAPRPFLALEGITDTISLPEAVRQSILAARPAYALFNAEDRLGVHYANHGHAFTAEDWTAMLDFFDKHLRGKTIDRRFDTYPTEAELDAAAAAQPSRPPSDRARAWKELQSRLPQEKYQRHSLAVEAIMRELATPGTDNLDHWALAGLLHDIDIAETANDLARHGILGAGILRGLQFPEPVIHAVNAHDDRAGVARASRLDHAVYCADQLYWLVTATGHAIPSVKLSTAKPEAIWEQARQLPSKKPLLDELTSECAAIGQTMPKAIAALQAASGKLQAAGSH
ncbi:glucuronyl esterase domain-containing protein [Paludibaculum fermentans]|uniref:glucuronyl esterase domain-containing protein n=1 Tax=Paludibaculum fermentans TaxID=1473598 RepID=UPI003EB81EE8